MQIQEGEFTQESHDWGVQRLEELRNAPDTMIVGFARANATKYVEGWLLKKAALKSLEGGETSAESRDVIAFCEFLVTKAFYHD